MALQCKYSLPLRDKCIYSSCVVWWCSLLFIASKFIFPTHFLHPSLLLLLLLSIFSSPVFHLKPKWQTGIKQKVMWGKFISSWGNYMCKVTGRSKFSCLRNTGKLYLVSEKLPAVREAESSSWQDQRQARIKHTWLCRTQLGFGFWDACVHLFSCVRLCAALWTVACQASLSMEFSRQ